MSNAIPGLRTPQQTGHLAITNLGVVTESIFAAYHYTPRVKPGVTVLVQVARAG